MPGKWAESWGLLIAVPKGKVENTTGTQQLVAGRGDLSGVLCM